ncbi:MAG: GNAT family N-acetyltransferase [Defluviitaleaceae bacterium]|nr:GNAT family N-acetyltransferase [Defluviitaleaceae bacterium]
MIIISVRDNPQYLDGLVDYYCSAWKLNREIWRELIGDCVTTKNPLPRWYIMLDGENIIGCVGLMVDGSEPNLAGLYIDEDKRSKGLGALLANHAVEEAAGLGLSRIYLTTYHIGYFEKCGWTFLEEDNKVRKYTINTPYIQPQEEYK